jgi:tryptophanyl-tRNA synthetase
MTMVTDPQRTHRNIPGRPEVCNVFTLHRSFAPEADMERIAADCRSAKLGCVDDKKCLAANINRDLAGFRARRAELAKNPDYVWDVLSDGARRARIIAEATMEEVRTAIGLP